MITDEQLDSFQRLVAGGENLPEGDGWMTMAEWHNFLNGRGVKIGYNRLRAALNKYGEIYHGAAYNEERGKVFNQVWYRMDFKQFG